MASPKMVTTGWTTGDTSWLVFDGRLQLSLWLGPLLFRSNDTLDKLSDIKFNDPNKPVKWDISLPGLHTAPLQQTQPSLRRTFRTGLSTSPGGCLAPSTTSTCTTPTPPSQTGSHGRPASPRLRTRRGRWASVCRQERRPWSAGSHQ